VIKVNVKLIRAKTALQFDKYYTSAGGINQFDHSRSVAGMSKTEAVSDLIETRSTALRLLKYQQKVQW
jgi:hypothetical protein